MNQNSPDSRLAAFDGVSSLARLLDAVEEANKILFRGFDKKANYLKCTIEYLYQEKVLAGIRKRQKTLDRLRTDGHGLLNWWGGDLAEGCRICLFSKNGFRPIRSVTRCNLRCHFCYYNDSHDTFEDLKPWHFQINSRYREADDIKVMLDKQSDTLDGIAWVFFEPFLDVEKHLDLIGHIHDLGIYQWMYTNGTLCNRENLTRLADAGLDELRFNLAATLCDAGVIRQVRTAASLFASVGIESPMFDQYFQALKENRHALLDSGIGFINCAELHLHQGNLPHYANDELYVYKYGYVSPLKSRHLTYDLMDLAELEGWKGITIHDCSNQTKIYRGILGRSDFGTVDYTSQQGLPPGWHRKIILAHPDYFERFLDSPTQDQEACNDPRVHRQMDFYQR
jgi:hypothetical protein